jgi:GH35 family endo-1,4-beta-xylanase
VAAATLFALVVSPVLRAQSATPSSLGTLRQAGASRSVIVGAAADPSHLTEPNYASTLATQFAQLEPENQMKFQVIHPRPGNEPSAYDFSPADRLVDFASQHNMKVRGHCFVWHQQVPE